jgi:hypothetical protein
MQDLTPYAIAWAALGLVVLVLAIMRRQIAAKEDDTLHLASGEAALVEEQVATAKKLARVDRWGKLLTVVLVLAGVGLAVAYGMKVWEETTSIGLK